MVTGPPYTCPHCGHEEDTIEDAKDHFKTHRVVKSRDEDGQIIRRVV